MKNTPYPLEQIGQVSNAGHSHDNYLKHQYPNNALITQGLNNKVQGVELTVSMVELSISCTNLSDCDIITKSDPQVIVYSIDGTGNKYEIGRTEVIQDNLNPKFAKKVITRYNFEQIQRLLFEVYDIDPVGGDDFLGGLNTTLADIIATRSSTYKHPLVGGPRKKSGHLIVEAEELTACKQVATFVLKASDLPSYCCGIFNPSTRIHIYRSSESGSWTIVHRSKIAGKTSDPDFGIFQLKLVTLCNGDFGRTIKFELFDLRFGREVSLGSSETTVNSLKRDSIDKPDQAYSLSKNDNSYNSILTDSGKIIFSNFRLVTQATFLDYIKAGTQIHFVIAVDFTASNGDPAHPSSLHYLEPMGRRMNPYEAALLAIGNVIKPYDTTGLFAGFGFGAKLNGTARPPSHLFPLNGNDQHPYVSSIEELLKVYRKTLATASLSGPTNFSPCIAHSNNIAQQFQDGNHYFVLLIVTDGIISDMHETKKAIIESSKSPLSIIICGVGDAEFTEMNELDSDDAVMKLDGKSAERDIVQFVPLNQYISNAKGSIEIGCTLLAEEVLREIPDQLTGYMTSHGFHSELTYTCN